MTTAPYTPWCPHGDPYCGLNGRCGRCRRRPGLVETVSDEHPDQPRFEGGPLIGLLWVLLFWVVVFVIAGIVLSRLTPMAS